MLITFLMTLTLDCGQINGLSSGNILSFGGNGMIGSAVLSRLIEKKQYNITMVSRGHWHYDSNVRIKPYVNDVICDRNKVPKCDNCSINALIYCHDFMKVVNETIDGFDAVFDFSAFEPKWVHDAIEVLKSKPVGVYVYISSDAVYEVSVPKATKRLSKEEDAIRPTDPKLRDKLMKQDPYGHAKLAGEEALANQNHFPWLTFRFADVIGPRDVTHRFAFYHTWLKFYDDIKINFHIPQKIDEIEESITYVEDAAEVIARAIDVEDAWNNAFNVASTPPLHTLRSIIMEMADIMDVSIDETDPSDQNLHMYPTVFSGGIDIEKAQRMLKFVPTDFSEALKNTIEWYDNEFLHQYDYREEMVADLMARIVPRERRDQVYLAVERELAKAGVPASNAKRKGDIEHLENFDKTLKFKQEL